MGASHYACRVQREVSFYLADFLLPFSNNFTWAPFTKRAFALLVYHGTLVGFASGQNSPIKILSGC